MKLKTKKNVKFGIKRAKANYALKGLKAPTALK